MFKRSVFYILLVLFSSLILNAQKLPSKKKIVEVMRLTNQYFMNKWPDTGKDIVLVAKNKTWPSHIWTRAVYYEGLMALYSVDKKPAYYDYAVDWGTKHNWSLRETFANPTPAPEF